MKTIKNILPTLDDPKYFFGFAIMVFIGGVIASIAASHLTLTNIHITFFGVMIMLVGFAGMVVSDNDSRTNKVRN